MRLLHVTHRYLPRFSTGTEVYAATLVGGLRARGHQQQVFTGDPESAKPHTYRWEEVPIHAVPWGLGGQAGPVGTFLAGFFNPAVERWFRRLCAEFQPDVVHVHHLMGLSPNLPAIARASGAAVVITLHDYWFLCSNTWLYRYDHQLCPGPGFGYHCGGCALHRWQRPPQPLLMTLTAPLFMARTARLRQALRAARRLVAPSLRAAEAYARHGLPPGALTVVPHGLNTAPAAARPSAAGGLRFAIVGVLIRPKGAHVVLEAFRGLSGPDLELCLIGDITADPAYVQELRRLAGDDPRITFTGSLPRAEVQARLRAADVLLMPSLWTETHSLVVDEARAAGLPVIVSAHSAAAERVGAGQDGLHAAPGDAAEWRRQMQRLVSEPGLLTQLRAGLQPPPELSEHVRRIESLYTDLLHSGRPVDPRESTVT